jgi:hypothetical protein
VFDEKMELDSLSSLTEDEDMDEDAGKSEASDEVTGGEGVGGVLIPKPKGDVSRPGRGGYNLCKKLGWNQKTYDSVLVSKSEYKRESISHQTTRYSLQRWLRKGSIQPKAIVDKTRGKCANLRKWSAT